MAPEVGSLVRGGLRTARAFSRRIPGAGEVLAPSLSGRVAGRPVLVTGASSGIGRDTALKIGAAGGHVLLVARTRETLDEVAAAIRTGGGIAHAYSCDLTDLDQIDGLVKEIVGEHGVPEVLVNNAGHSIRRSVRHSYDRFHDYERTMQLNYFGAVRLILGLLPGMRERGSGHIINISTMGLQTNTPRFSAYLASKAALDAFSRSVASEVILEGVHFTTIYMPLVRTPMIAPTEHYERLPAMSSDGAADLVVEAIRRRPKRISTAFGNLVAFTYATAPGAQDLVLSKIGNWVA